MLEHLIEIGGGGLDRGGGGDRGEGLNRRGRVLDGGYYGGYYGNGFRWRWTLRGKRV